MGVLIFISDRLKRASPLQELTQGCRHNEKPIDLSRTIQLSGLSPGAKLTLVQASRTAVPVSVALQLPQSASSVPNTRLVDRFPSDTTLWQILRRFESGVAGGTSTAGKNFNFTQRAIPVMSNGDSANFDGAGGAGRLCYEMPTLNIMGRQLESVSDLSKTLHQLGMKGNVMMRLSFKNTSAPLEEVMSEISKYFDAIEEKPEHAGGLPTDAELEDEPSGLTGTSGDTAGPVGGQSEQAPLEAPLDAPEVPTQSTSESNTQPTENISVFAPPAASATTSSAAYDDTDYIPTAEHARSHQANLNRASRNKKLLSESELEKQRSDRDVELTKVSTITVRLRFPDQSMVQQEYGQDCVLKDLYETCSRVLSPPHNEDVELHAASGAGGGAVQGSGAGAVKTLPKNEQRLIRDLGWTGRVLVTVGWAEHVASERRSQPSLRPELRAQAKELKMADPTGDAQMAGKTLGNAPQPDSGQESKESDRGKKGADKEAKLKKLLGFKKK